MKRKISDGKWRVETYVGKDPSGRYIRRSRTIYGTLADAKRLEVELLSTRTVGPSRKGSPTVSEFLDHWLAATNVARQPSTQTTYKHQLKHVADVLGRVKLDRLTPEQVQTMYAQLAPTMSPRYLRDIHRTFTSALKTAVIWGLIAQNPCKTAVLPRVPKRAITALDRDQTHDLFRAAAGTNLECLVVVAATTGARQGELLALTWNDIDLPGGVLAIRRSLQRVPGGTRFSTPKTDSSQRKVLLTPDTVDSLRQHRSRQLEHRMRLGRAYHDYDLVFPTATGEPRDPTALRNAWLQILRKAGLEFIDGRRFRFHDLRHTHASQLLEQGVPVPVVSERLGHANPSITLETYSHVIRGAQERAVELYGNWLRDGGGDQREAAP